MPTKGLAARSYGVSVSVFEAGLLDRYKMWDRDRKPARSAGAAAGREPVAELLGPVIAQLTRLNVMEEQH